MTREEYAHAIAEVEAASERDGYTLNIYLKSGDGFWNAATWATNGNGLLKVTCGNGSLGLIAISEIAAVQVAA